MALIAGYFGQQQLAAQTTACSLLYLLPLGFGIASANRIGNLLGEKNYKTASLIAKTTMAFGLCLGIFNLTFLVSVKNLWGFLFTDDPFVLDAVGKLMPLVVLYQFSDAIKAVGSGILQGCGLKGLVL